MSRNNPYVVFESFNHFCNKVLYEVVNMDTFSTVEIHDDKEEAERRRDIFNQVTSNND